MTLSATAGPDKRDYRVDFTRISEQLPAFKPEWTICAGIDELVQDMRTFGMSTTDFEGPRYVRLERIRELLATQRLDHELRITEGAR